jgi:hypothetical protein
MIELDNMVETKVQSPPKVNVSIGEKDDRVILSFDKEISWLEMEPVVAIRVAETMKEKAIAILRE